MHTGLAADLLQLNNLMWIVREGGGDVGQQWAACIPPLFLARIHVQNEQLLCWGQGLLPSTVLHLLYKCQSGEGLSLL